MPTPTPPTAASIRSASALRPEQVDLTYANTSAMDADITDMLTEQTAYVEMMLQQAATPQPYPFVTDFLSIVYPNYSSLQITSVIERHSTNQYLAIKYFTLSALFSKAGQLNERYLERAKYYWERGEDTIAMLTKDFTWIVATGDTNGNNPNSGIKVLSINVADNFSEDAF